MTHGLLFRLEKRNPREGDWLRGRVPSLMAQFSLAKHHRGEREAYLELVRWLRTARIPKSNTPKCDPVVLLAHHRLAKEKLEGLARVLGLPGKPVVKELKVESAVKDLCKEIRDERPRCACGREPEVPPDLKTWLGKKRTVGALIDYCLLHCHHKLTLASLDHLLNKGSRTVRPINRAVDERFKHVKPKS